MIHWYLKVTILDIIDAVTRDRYEPIVFSKIKIPVMDYYSHIPVINYEFLVFPIISSDKIITKITVKYVFNYN